ncbi:MAG: hypothetical protein JO033_12645 [Acidobacteriaceae bacterium]|nr:hypothetical protein [Acidobacteriaceae bacterium]
MRKLFLTIFVAAICLAPASIPNAIAQEAGTQAAAQHHEPPAVLEIVRESIKEGHTAAHEKVETDWAAAFRKHSFPNYQFALTSMTGPSEALFLVTFPSFAGVEESAQTFQKPDIKTEMEMLDTRDGEHRTISRTMYAVYRKDMSYRPDLVNVAKTRYVGVTIFRPKLGHMQDFEEGSKKFLAADEKAGLKTPSVAYQVIGGVSGDMVIFFEPMESLKQLDDYPAREKAVSEAMGDDYQKMMKGAGDVFTSIEYNLYAVNPGMSYVSKETEDADPAFWRPTATSAKASQ